MKKLLILLLLSFSTCLCAQEGHVVKVFEELNLMIVTTAGHYNVQSPINEIVGKYILPAVVKK